MRTALDTPTEKLDAHERDFVSKIREHGWFRTSVFGDNAGPNFSYTTGLWVNHQRPEVIVFSLKSEIAHDILWDVYRDAEAGRIYPLGEPVSGVFGNTDAVFTQVAKEHYADYLGWNRWFYGGDDFPCLQLIWPDRIGLFPWQPAASEEFAVSQPDLSPDGWGKSTG
jgi:Domain of unknown function (DUF4262)